MIYLPSALRRGSVFRPQGPVREECDSGELVSEMREAGRPVVKGTRATS